MPWQGYVEQHWPPPFEELNVTLRRRSRDIAEGAVPSPAVAALLATPTGAVAQAPPAPGRFPVVLYFGGLNADLHANAVLAELLASHGYVVVSISLLGPSDRQTSQSRTPADIEAVVRDMEYAWSLLGDDPSIDRTRVATMGHSVGAIEAVLFGMRNGNVSAVVGLDGTYGFSGSVAALTSAYGYAPDAMRAAILDLRRAPGEQSAELDLQALHSFRYADRRLVTLRRMHHSDFTSFAMIAQLFHTPINSRAPAGEWNRETAAKGYQDTCGIVLAFLEDQLKEHLKKKPERLAAVVAGIGGAVMTRSGASAVPPSAFELVRLVAQKGMAATQTLATEICGNNVAACLQEGPLNSLGYELLAQDRAEDAVAAFRIAAWAHPSSANAQDSLADGCLAIHDRECGRQALERAIALAPDDPALDAASRAQFIASATARIRALN
jgi:dienelactone hydrolase